MENKVALIIIYNHQYIENIDISEKIYSERFKNIYHLVPFYNGCKINVIPVYESSFYFQGYISQGYKCFLKEEYNHYIFVADDLLLNPKINENNYCDFFHLDHNTCFIPGFISLHEVTGYWERVGDAFRWNLNQPGIEVYNQLPDYELALQKLNEYHLSFSPLSFFQIWKKPDSLKKWIKTMLTDTRYFLRIIYNHLSRKKYSLSYPLVGSYSDICIVSKSYIKPFCHFCGVFAATNLFVELALPTALALSADKIVSEKDLNSTGKTMWTKLDFLELDKHEKSLKSLLSNYPSEYLYLHPVKFSIWDCNL